jgi:hypothetical protein
MLVNLADVGREAGEYRAALGACVRALELAEAARLRLPALGCATIASALLGEHALVDHFISDVEQTVSRSGLSFENARALTEVGEALAILGDFRAFGYASRAALVARRAGFHEITARTLQIEAALNDRLGGVALGQPRLKRVRWSRSTRAIFNRMEVMSIHGQRAAAIGVAG